MITKSSFYEVVDYFITVFFLHFFSFKKKTNNLKFGQLNNNTFYLFNNNFVKNNTQFFLYGLRSAWKHLRLWTIPIIISLFFVYFSFFLKTLPFTKTIFAYIVIGNLVYLFLSGFVFFIKRYQYRLYTSSIQRFWRRSLTIFWAIEGSLFCTFFYLILNANQEPVYMYDNTQLFKTHFYSWRYFLPKIVLSTLLIVFTYMFLLVVKWNSFSKLNNFVLLITLIVLYIMWLEFYQLFHLMNCYGTTNWVYDFSDHLWNLDVEFKRTRIVNHYVTIGLVAKFWHVVFAVVFWIFFILRGTELSRFRFPLLAANLQNFIIIYIMSWL